MSNFILSAELVLKDKMTAGLKKTGYALSGIAGEALKVTKNTDTMKKSLSGIRENYQATLSIKDIAITSVSKVKGLLNDFKNKDYSSIISVKDRASQQISKVKSELTGLANKAIMAYVNVKTNMPNGGFNLNNKVEGMLMGTGMQMAGAAGIGYGVYDTIKTSMDFDYQLSAIKSLISKDGQDGKTRDEIMAQIRERAMQLGQDTVFGNTDVARGMTELVKAGVQLKDVLGDASEAALNLATAGELSLPEAAETMSTAMNAFKVTDATHAANILAGAANASATDVHELRYSLAACSAVAAGAGVSFEDTNTALAVFAQNGLKGSDAGTSLKTMLSNLIPKTKTQIEAFSKLNLLTEKGTSAFFDQQGKVKSLAEIAGLLQDRLKGMTKEEQMSTLYDMFGSDAIRGGMILMREGAEGATEMFEEMNKVTAKEMAITQLDNLKGDIEELSGAWENFQITLMSGSGTTGLRSFTKELTEFVKLATDGLKDGFGFDDIFALVGKGITDLTKKFIAFDGIGSVLAGGALVGVLVKMYKLITKIGSGIKSVNDVINGIRGFGNSPVKIPTKTPEKNLQSMIVNAATVIVNGRFSKDDSNKGGHGKRSKQKTKLPVPETIPKPPSAPIPKPKSILGNISDGAKWLGTHAKSVGGAMLGLNAILGAYDIYNAPKDERVSTAGSVAGSLGGGLAGAKLGAMTGGAIGSVVPGIGTAVGAGVGGAIGSIAGSTLGEDIGEFIGSSLKNIDLSGIKTSISNILEWIKNGFSNNVQFITELFSNLGSGIGEFLSSGISSVQGTLSGIGDSIYNGILAPLGNIGINILNIIVGSGAMIYEALSPTFEAIGESISTNLIKPISDEFTNFTDFIKTVWADITDTIDTSLIEPVTANMYTLRYNITSAFDQAKDWIQSNWNEISDWFGENIWQPISSGAEYVCSITSGFFTSAWNAVQSVWNTATSFFGGIYDAIAGFANSCCDAISSAFSSAVNAVKTAWNGIVEWFSANVYEPLAEKARSVMNFVSSVKSKGEAITGLAPSLGHNATGTMNWHGGWTEINEQGGEIVDLPTGSRIYPAQTTERIIKNELTNNSSSSSNNVTITGNTFIVRNEQDIDEIAYRLMSLMRQVDANYGGAY